MRRSGSLEPRISPGIASGFDVHQRYAPILNCMYSIGPVCIMNLIASAIVDLFELDCLRSGPALQLSNRISLT